MKGKRKNIKLIFLSALFILGLRGGAMAEKIEFINHSTNVTHLELDLALFDLRVNDLRILSSPSFQYLDFIHSTVDAPDEITCWVKVSPTIMDGSLGERKKRLDKLCNDLFQEYQDRFLMIDLDLDYNKEPLKPALRMKPCNLKIRVHTVGIPAKFLVVWHCGSMSYKEDFLKK